MLPELFIFGSKDFYERNRFFLHSAHRFLQLVFSFYQLFSTPSYFSFVTIQTNYFRLFFSTAFHMSNLSASRRSRDALLKVLPRMCKTLTVPWSRETAAIFITKWCGIISVTFFLIFSVTNLAVFCLIFSARIRLTE